MQDTRHMSVFVPKTTVFLWCVSEHAHRRDEPCGLPHVHNRLAQELNLRVLLVRREQGRRGAIWHERREGVRRGHERQMERYRLGHAEHP